MRDRAAAPLADAMALMVRERLTGLPPPANAKALVEAGAPRSSASAGADARQARRSGRRSARMFALLMRDVLNDLGIGDELGAEDDKDDSADKADATEPPPQAENSEGEDEQEQQAPADWK